MAKRKRRVREHFQHGLKALNLNAIIPMAVPRVLVSLYGLVRDRLSCEPLSGHLFLFCNAQRNRLKVLVWDGSGLCNPSTESPQYRV
jgi:IS66 Orf2 like protein